MSKKSGSKEENPFSFKAYLESGGPSTSDEIPPPPLPPTPSLPLPQTSTSNLISPREAPNPFSFKNFLDETNLEKNLPILDDEEKDDDHLPADIPTPLADDSSASQSLLDHLPEIVSNTPPVVLHDTDIVPDVADLLLSRQASTSSSLDSRSQEERLIAKQREKIERLERKLRSLMDKEETENKTLAMVAAQVEKNLEEANKRRVAAESALELVKLENAQLKAQLLSLSNENLLLKTTAAQHGGSTRVGLFRTIGDIAGELNEAAKSAESSLAYLGTGVNTLRFIAQRLESLEKISEIL